MGHANAAFPTPITDVIVVPWPIELVFQAGKRLVNPQAPSWRSVSTSSRSASGMMVCVMAEVPSEVSNLRQSTPFRTVNWSQICSRRREDRLKLPSSSALGFFPDSWPRRSGLKMGSASCAFRSSETGSDSGGCMDVAEIVPWISEVWLSLPHCLQGRQERASAFVCFFYHACVRSQSPAPATFPAIVPVDPPALGSCAAR